MRIEKECFSVKHISIMLFMILMVINTATAQNAKITGKIISSEDGSPVAGATIKNQQSGKSAVADAQGQFSIAAAPNDKLVVGAVSFNSVITVVVKGKTQYNITLKTKINDGLSDVIVVGYGSVNKRDFTGAIGQVDMNDMLKAPVKSFDEMLAGRVAGVQVTSNDGQPGGSINIVVRGANSVTQDNSPLYVIDGFPIENPDNNALNPDDIESINVLKDASATAIYGARGANGVIIITTKGGKIGDPVVSLSSYYGLQKVSKTIDMMQPADFVQYILERTPSTTPWDPSTATTSITPYQLYFSGGTTLDYYKDTAKFIDWQNMILNDASMFNTTLNVSGGSKGTRYSVSGNIVNQDGIVINSGYKRYQGRASLDQTFNKHFKAGINVNYSRLEQNGTIVAQSNNSGTKSVMYSVWGYRPVEASPASQAFTGVTDNYDDGDASVDPTVSSTQDYRFNPVRNLINSYNRVYTNNLITNAYLEYTIIPELILRITGGLNQRLVRQDKFNNSNTQFGNPFTTSNGPNGSIIYNTNNSWLNENYLTYNKVFNKLHTLNIVADISEQKVTTSSYGTSAIQVPNEQLGIDALSQGTPQSITSVSSLNTSLSYLARANYSYASKYLLTLAFRRDGSSKFAQVNHWGNFPSGAIAWNFNKEDFLKGFKALTEGKLRISYGATGNNRVSDFAYLPTYSQSPGTTTVYTLITILLQAQFQLQLQILI